MSNSYYCCVCGQEMLEIKNADSLINNIADILILCEECEKNNKLCISAEKNIKFISPGKCKWKKEYSPSADLHYYETSCNNNTAQECLRSNKFEPKYIKNCPFCKKEIEEI